MKSPVRVLQVTPSYWPATKWGGPVFSTLAICDGVAARGDVLVEVLTTDAAGPERGDSLDVDPGQVRFEAGYNVTYARRLAGRDIAPGLVVRLLPAMRRADVVHLTATYSFPTLPTLAMAKVLGKPLLWSPRGALQARHEWDAAHSRSKFLFEQACRALMPKTALLHVTSKAEKAMSNLSVPGIPTAIVVNSVPHPPDPSGRPYRPTGHLRIAFLSRVHPKKGLETLIDAIAAAGARLAHATLDVYGTGEKDYVDALQTRAAERGIGGRVVFHGHVDGTNKTSAYLGADVFVLPSYSENFGIVVAEALSFRVPVITSTISPWADTVRAGCGLQVAAGDVDGLANAITELEGRDLAEMGAAGRRFVEAQLSDVAIAGEMAALYRSLAARDLAPFI